MNISRMDSIFKLAHLSNDSVHMVGLHGIGKSKIVESFSKENGFHLEILMLSQNEVADLIGMPGDVITGTERVMHWSKPSWFDRIEKAHAMGKHCVLFLDEIARAPLEVRQSALQLVLDGRIHEHHLPRKDGLKTLVIAADNPSDLYQTDELDPALLDRFMTYKVETDIKGWLEWANKNNVEPVITDFLAEFPENLHNQFQNGEDDKGSTPRAWAKLSDIIKNFDVINKNMYLSVIESKIGKTVGNSFFLYFNDYIKVLKVEDIVRMIGTNPIKTQSEQKKVIGMISSKTRDMEALSAIQLANKMKNHIENDKDFNRDVLTVFLGSLNLEVLAGILKTWKEKPESQGFYYDFAEFVPDRWLFSLITSKKQM